ncbi:MAG: PTS sugar transporter subunit IIA [Elusimicrobia bacterium]|nr:PTS sugar transporter subunit IIA [Candidatus Obscuribacterium magneticum]
MKILDILDPSCVTLDVKGPAKKEAIQELCELLFAKAKIKDVQIVKKALLEREALGSTGIGQGIAIPHGKSDGTETLVAALGVSKKGIDFESLDGEPVHLIFLLAGPPDSAGPHLKALARISRLLKDKFFRQQLRDAKSVDEVLHVIKSEDEE